MYQPATWFSTSTTATSTTTIWAGITAGAAPPPRLSEVRPRRRQKCRSKRLHRFINPTTTTTVTGSGKFLERSVDSFKRNNTDCRTFPSLQWLVDFRMGLRPSSVPFIFAVLISQSLKITVTFLALIKFKGAENLGHFCFKRREELRWKSYSLDDLLKLRNIDILAVLNLDKNREALCEK